MKLSVKDEIKNNLSIEQVEDFVMELGAEPRRYGGTLTCKTICHCGNSHKLYYYENTKLFKCYTDCGGEAFDLFDLIVRHKKADHKQIMVNGRERDWTLPDAIKLVASYFHLPIEEDDGNELDEVSGVDVWGHLRKKQKIISTTTLEADVNLPTYDEHLLDRFPQPRIYPWEREGIDYGTIKKFNVKYDPLNGDIIIPHYNVDNKLIGIRARTLIQEKAKKGAKYMPAKIGKKMYNHPLSFNVYNLNHAKNNIKKSKLAIIGEGEKFCMMFSSMFGSENDISVAVCGSNLIQYQMQLLKEAGAKELVIAFDKQFKEIGDKEWKMWTDKLLMIHKKYGKFIKISYMFDRSGKMLDYKDSPIDKGKDVFMQLFKERFSLQ